MSKSAVKQEARVPDTQVLLTTGQAARILQVSPKALEAWRYRGGGPLYCRISAKVVRYRLSDLEDWIAEHIRSSTSDSGG